MKAMLLRRLVASLRDTDAPLECADIDRPEPGPGEVLVAVSACGVCHTELDEIEGRMPPPRLPVVPGHQIVGRVVAVGDGVDAGRVGERVGIGWIHASDGSEHENLSAAFCATGRDVDGGYAEFATASARCAVPIPGVFADVEAAPLLCAGAVGYRALRLSGLGDGQRLGLTGFGGSAHLVLQTVRHCFPAAEVYVFARDDGERAFARELGACWAGDTAERAPRPLDAIIDTTPAWRPVVEALANLRPGGRLVINAIRKEAADQQELLRLSYHDHLWLEREIKTVANVTARDLHEFLPLAAAAGLRPEVATHRLEDANRALVDLRCGGVRGAKVLVVGDPGAAV